MATNDKNQGEGNREAARQYNEATRKFVESGKVEDKAREAKEVDATEQAELEKAEEAGKKHAKEEDPEVHRDYTKPDKL